MSRYQPKYFKYSEFDSPDQPGSGDKINDKLLIALDYVRQQLEQPISINSGYRTEQHNQNVGGVSNSQHLKGNAADVCINSQEMGDLIEYWFVDCVGQDCGIGRYNTFIHCDVRNTKARWDRR